VAIELKFLDNSNTALMNVSNILGVNELVRAQTECEAAIKAIGNINILAILDDFQGWEKSEAWADLTFVDKNDEFIDKIAIVGDEKWKDFAYAFTIKGLRPTPIEFFAAGEKDAAIKWLKESS